MKNINQKAVILEYFDYTLGKMATRDMTLEGSDIEKLYFFGGDLNSILGLSVTFSCRKGYFTYEEL